VRLHHWGIAFELAERYDFPQVQGILSKLVQSAILQEKQLHAVELFRVANKPADAALLLAQIADVSIYETVRPSLAKKLHVLAALEIERHRKRTIDALATDATTAVMGGTVAQNTASTLDTLLMTNINSTDATATTTMIGSSKKLDRTFGNAWRGAAAYHYYMLAHRQYFKGNLDAAMKTSIRLCEYDDILHPRDIYSILAVTAFQNQFFGLSSHAFVKLASLSDLPGKDHATLQALAINIFTLNNPTDPVKLPDAYTKCLETGRSYRACLLSGRAILDSETKECQTCRYSVLEHEARPIPKHCPLCHMKFSWQ
jgi:WD repeat-containing protein 35